MKKSHSEIPEHFTLRRGLKALFHYQDVDTVIDALCVENIHLYKERLADDLTELLRIEPEGNTIDQNESVACEFSQKYTKNGVFDALSDFVSGCCHYAGNSLVCNKASLLRWHETSSLLSEDLLVCSYLAANNIKPLSYAWTPFISTDREGVNDILAKELADVHAHLVGSSFNFDVNWICLMNYPDGREHLFKNVENSLQNRTSILHYNCNRRSYHTLSVIAAAIRIALYGKLIGVEPESKDLLNVGLNSLKDLDREDLLKSTLRDIKSFKKDGYFYREFDSIPGVQYDYAHSEMLKRPDAESCAYSVFTGERYIQYGMLSNIYENKLSEYETSLFYIYLLIKHKIRHELIQTNDEVGFRNFHLYDDRKMLFIKDERIKTDYIGLLKHLSVASMFAGNQSGRWLETRMAPWDDIEKQVRNTDKKVIDPKLKRSAEDWRYGYIFHFIKHPDDTDIKLNDCVVRHDELRQKLKGQAMTIVSARRKEEGAIDDGILSSHRILGIDAASSEVAARPEVFAQAFRYIRRCVLNMGITYHVGEDFYDIVDGLRAIDECIRFLDLHSHDRIGHALALGTDVEKYYCNRRNVITMPKQVALDNVVWLYNHFAKCCTKKSLMRKLYALYKDLFSDIYGKDRPIPDIDIYYSSWLLRGDDPRQYQVNGIIETKDELDIEWHAERFLKQREANMARSNPNIQKLHYLYHYDYDIKKNGAQVTALKFTPDLIKAIKNVQKRMLDKVDTLKLCIECNPTSNFKIGDIDRYDEHPIRKFYTKGLACTCRGRNISSSINTDDKGIFATSIEREYALIAEAFIRDLGGTKKAETRVVNWLDNIRKCSIDQKFIKC